MCIETSSVKGESINSKVEVISEVIFKRSISRPSRPRSLLNNSLTINQDAATISIEQLSTITTSINSFIDVNDEYIGGITELIRQRSDNTTCIYLYLPRPPSDKTLSQRYIHVLDMLSNNLPPIMFVHGVSSVPCTQL